MEQSKQLQETLKLGKKIVQELNLDHDNDTLTRWMAFYLSELMIRTESETVEAEKVRLEKECVDLIMAIWNRREIEFDRFIPLKDLQGTIEVLKIFQKEEGNMWQLSYPFLPDDPLADFASSINTTGYKIIQAVLHLSLLPDKLRNAKDWKENFGELLSEEESKLIDMLDFYLNDFTRNRFVVTVRTENIEAPLDAEEYISEVFNRLDALLAKQRDALQQLRENLTAGKAAK